MDVVFKLEQEHAIYSVYTWRSLLVMLWKDLPTVAAVSASSAVVGSWLDRAPNKVLFTSISAAGIALPDGPAREALQQSIKKTEPRIHAAVNVILASGFAGAAVRSVFTGFSLVVRPSYPVSFVGTLEEGAANMVRHWPPTDAPAPSATELLAALRTITPK